MLVEFFTKVGTIWAGCLLVYIAIRGSGSDKFSFTKSFYEREMQGGWFFKDWWTETKWAKSNFTIERINKPWEHYVLLGVEGFVTIFFAVGIPFTGLVLLASFTSGDNFGRFLFLFVVYNAIREVFHPHSWYCSRKNHEHYKKIRLAKESRLEWQIKNSMK